MIWTDNMFIPTGGSVPTASTYMNFVYDPGSRPRSPPYVNYVTPVKGARRSSRRSIPDARTTR